MKCENCPDGYDCESGVYATGSRALVEEAERPYRDALERYGRVWEAVLRLLVRIERGVFPATWVAGLEAPEPSRPLSADVARNAAERAEESE